MAAPEDAGLRILALDLATTSGWVCDSYEPGRPPQHGHYTIPEKDRACYGDMMLAHMKWLRGIRGLTEPDAMAFEAPLVRAGGGEFKGAPSSRHSVIVTLGLAICAQVVAAERGIVVHGVSVQTARKHFTGNGRAQKADVQLRCRQLGWPIEQPDEADAAAVWMWAKCTFDKGFRWP